MPAKTVCHVYTSKTCHHCQREFTELFDSYAEICPECQLGHTGTLISTEGGWIWQGEE